MKITKQQLKQIIREEVDNFKLEEGGFGEGANISTLKDAVREIGNQAEAVNRIRQRVVPVVDASEDDALARVMKGLFDIGARLELLDSDTRMAEEDTLKLPKLKTDPLGRGDEEDKLRKGARERWEARNFSSRKRRPKK